MTTCWCQNYAITAIARIAVSKSIRATTSPARNCREAKCVAGRGFFPLLSSFSKKPSRCTHKNRRNEQNKNYDFNNLETYIFRLFSFLPAHSLSSYVLIFFLFLILFYSILSVISWASQSQTLMMLHHSENEHQANTREEKQKNRLKKNKIKYKSRPAIREWSQSVCAFGCAHFFMLLLYTVSSLLSTISKNMLR